VPPSGVEPQEPARSRGQCESIRADPAQMGAHGFVSKNDQVEKADRKEDMS